MPYGDKWRLFRKAMHGALHDGTAKTYQPIQENEARTAVLTLGNLSEGADFQPVNRYAASVIMQVTYDYETTSLDDPLIQAVKARGEALGRCLQPGVSVLDRYPFLEHLPTVVNPWKREGLRLRKLEQDLFLGEVFKVCDRMKRGACAPCFTSKMWERQAELGLTDRDLAGMCGSLFGAGSDTTANALSVFILAICRYPAVLAKLQEEVDRVVGTERVPTFDDLPSLPHVRATVQEVLRWRPISAGGFAHTLTTDVEYKVYLFPKGSSVVGPHWSVSRDETEYHDHDLFQPERFLSDDETATKGTWFTPVRGSVAFGYGRRVCPGLAVAMHSLDINVAMMAWALDIKHPQEQPEEVNTLAFTSAVNCCPLPFAASFSCRNEARKKVVELENVAAGTGEVERLAAKATTGK